MEDENNIYSELAEIDALRDRIKLNQDQILDVYDSEDERLNALLVEMSELLEETDRVESEMQELMKQL